MVASLEEAHQIIVAQSDTIATLQARIEIVDAALKTALATIDHSCGRLRSLRGI